MPPTLLTLPPELRAKIYTHFLPASPIYHPLPTLGLTSASHAPPRANLLNIHPQLTAEILESYYAATS